MAMNHMAFVSLKAHFSFSVCILPKSQSNDLIL